MLKFCVCESIQGKFSESIQWIQIDLIGSACESIQIDSKQINMPALVNRSTTSIDNVIIFLRLRMIILGDDNVFSFSTTLPCFE